MRKSILITLAVISIVACIVSLEYGTFVKYFAILFLANACSSLGYSFNSHDKIPRKKTYILLSSIASLSLLISIIAYYVSEIFSLTSAIEIAIMGGILSAGGVCAIIALLNQSKSGCVALNEK